MKKTMFVTTALLAFNSTFAHAQTTPTPPTTTQIVTNMVARLTALLDLTAAQQTSATTYFTNEQNTLSTLRTSMQTARTALQTAIKSNDTATIASQSTQIGTLTGEEVLAQATANAAFYLILTADQQTKYNTLGGSLGFGGPGGGFGGPGAFGRPGR